MAGKMTEQVSKPLHIENTVRGLGKEELSGTQRFHTYRDMMYDSQIGGAVGLMQSMTGKLSFKLKPSEKTTAADKKMLAKIEASFHQMPVSFQQWMSYALSEISYGHSIFEKVYKREDGAFVIDSLSPIHPINVEKYVYDRLRLKELKLTAPENDGVVMQDSAPTTIAGDKVLIIKLNADLDNPLGRSILDRVYVDWKSKQIASEYELIGIAKNLSGVVKIEAPTEYIQDWYNKPDSDNARYLETLLEQAEMLHGGKSSVVLASSDTTQTNSKLFDIKQFGENTSANTFDIDKTISRFNNNILSSLYSDILSLGSNGGGSFALSDSKTNILGLFIESILATITTGVNEVVRELMKLNGVKNHSCFTVEWEDVDEKDLDKYARAWSRIGQSGLLRPTEELETELRTRFGVPKLEGETAIVVEGTTSAEPIESDKQL